MCRAILVVFAAALSVAACADTNTPAGPSGASPQVLTLVDVTTVAQVTSGGTGTWNWAGQSMKIVAAGRFDHIRFNWYTFQREPTAFGNAYILGDEYLGLPSNLSPSTPGFLARSTGVENGQYIFASDVTLQGGVTYWLYTDKQGAFAGSFDTDIYLDGDEYVTGHPTYPFHKVPASGRMIGDRFFPGPPGVFVDANFRLQGSAAQGS